MDETLGGYLCGALFAVAGLVQLLFGWRISRKAKQSLLGPRSPGLCLGRAWNTPAAIAVAEASTRCTSSMATASTARIAHPRAQQELQRSGGSGSGVGEVRQGEQRQSVP